MSEHTVTENLVQRNAETTATLTCSCSLSVEGSLRRKPLRALRVELARLHEASPADNGGEVCGPKKEVIEAEQEAMTTEDLAEEQRVVNKTVKKHRKSKAAKVTLEDDGKARKALEKDEDVNLEVESNEGDVES